MCSAHYRAVYGRMPPPPPETKPEEPPKAEESATRDPPRPSHFLIHPAPRFRIVSLVVASKQYL